MSERIFSRIENLFREKLNQKTPSNSSFASNQRELDRNWSNFEQRLDEAMPENSNSSYNLLKPLLILAILAFIGALYFGLKKSNELEQFKRTVQTDVSTVLKTDTVYKTVYIYSSKKALEQSLPAAPGDAEINAAHKTSELNSLIAKTKTPPVLQNSLRRVKSENILRSQKAADGLNPEVNSIRNVSPSQELQESAVFKNAARVTIFINNGTANTASLTAQLEKTTEKNDDAVSELKIAQSSNIKAPVFEPEWKTIELKKPGFISATDSNFLGLAGTLPVIRKQAASFFLPVSLRAGVNAYFEVVKNWLYRDQGCYGAGLAGEAAFGRRLSLGVTVGNIGNNFVRNEQTLDANGFRWRGAPAGYKASRVYGSWRYMDYSFSLHYQLLPNRNWSPYVGAGMGWQRDVPSVSHYSVYEIATRIEIPTPLPSSYTDTHVRSYLNFEAGVSHSFSKSLIGTLEAIYGKRSDSGDVESAYHYGVNAGLYYKL